MNTEMTYTKGRYPNFHLFLETPTSEKWLMFVDAANQPNSYQGVLQGQHLQDAFTVMKAMTPDGGRYDLLVTEDDDRFIEETLGEWKAPPLDKRIVVAKIHMPKEYALAVLSAHAQTIEAQQASFQNLDLPQHESNESNEK